MDLNPLDEGQVAFQYSLSIRNEVDLLSSLCPKVLEIIYQFLTSDDVSNMRAVSRRFLIYHLETSRLELFEIIRPRIDEGFECLYKSTLSATYLNSLKAPLSALLLTDSNNQEIIELSDSGHLEFFFIKTLQYYHQNDICAYWELVEVILRTKIFYPQEFVRTLGFKFDEAFRYACKFGLLCLGKTILKYSILSDGLDLYSGCFICLKEDHLTLFTVIINFLASGTIQAQCITDLLEEAVTEGKLEYIKLLFEKFPHLEF